MCLLIVQKTNYKPAHTNFDIYFMLWRIIILACCLFENWHQLLEEPINSAMHKGSAIFLLHCHGRGVIFLVLCLCFVLFSKTLRMPTSSEAHSQWIIGILAYTTLISWPLHGGVGPIIVPFPQLCHRPPAISRHLYRPGAHSEPQRHWTSRPIAGGSVEEPKRHSMESDTANNITGVGVTSWRWQPIGWGDDVIRKRRIAEDTQTTRFV